jgi:hypothetical protein
VRFPLARLNGEVGSKSSQINRASETQKLAGKRGERDTEFRLKKWVHNCEGVKIVTF